MDVLKFLSELKEKNITVSISGDDLDVEGPSELLTEDTIKVLKENKQEIKTYLKSRTQSTPTISPLPEQSDYETSHAQQRTWFLSQIEKDSYAYNIIESFELEGELNKDALENAFQKLIERHEALRTNFFMKKGELRQRINDIKNVGQIIEEEDLSNLDSASEKKQKAQELAEEEGKWSFDLANDSKLIRVKLFKITDTLHILVINQHHIISDGWSNEVLKRELSEIYTAQQENRKPNLEKIEVQLKDCTYYQNKLLQEEKTVKSQKYWKKLLEGELPSIDLPIAKPRPKIQSFYGEHVTFNIEKDHLEKLKEIAAQNQVSLFMVLQAITYLLIHKYSGQEDILLGTIIAGRDNPVLSNQIGLYLNTLVLRNEVNLDDTFNEFLMKIKTKTLEAYEHKDYPFDKLVEDLKLTKDTSRNPIFDVVISYQDYGESKLNLKGLKEQVLELNYDIAKFDLGFYFWQGENEGETICSIEYKTDLFDQGVIETMKVHMKELIKNIVNNDETIQLKDIEILSKEEREQMLKEVNNTKAEYPSDKCIHELFEAQVEKTPDNIAVAFENETITYAELNKQANQLARILKPNLNKDNEMNVIGIFMNRSVELVVGILAILKAGGAYIPLDPNYPEERIKYILDHSKCNVLLTQQSLNSKLELNDNVTVVEYENVEKELGQQEDSNLKLGNPKDLCYVIYTSGSTGNPKGVMIQHYNLVNFVTGIDSIFKFKDTDSMMCTTTVSFDIFGLEMHNTLTNGMKLIMLSGEGQKNPEILIEQIEKHQATHLQMTPTVFSSILDFDDEEVIFNTVKVLMLGGEKLPKDLAKRILKEFKGELYDMYGPTETTIWSLVEHVEEVKEDEDVPIGYPIQNTDVYLMDKNNRIVPRGVIGEIVIGGEGVGRGYLYDEEKTEKVFIENPYQKGEIIYKTGDLGKLLPNNKIECLGRVDFQVKIRGHRIELGEIESRLKEHSEIKDCVVWVKGEDEQKRLVGYYISDKEIEIGELREHLGSRVPEYMVPQYFMRLEEFPKTPNGKTDRKNLPDPDEENITTGTKYTAPETETEKKLAKIWMEVLGVEKVGIHDNFFEIGGHSLNATQISSRVRETLKKELSIIDVFNNPTISSQGQLLDKLSTQDDNSDFMITKISETDGVQIDQ